MLVSEVAGRTLHALGGDVVFGLMGSGNLAVTNAIVAAGGRFFSARHETGAVCMADGYARVSGRLGVVSVHQGPGLTNAITGLTEAAKSRTPLLLLAADTPAVQLRSNFRIDQDALVSAVGAVSERIHSPATVVADVARAVRRATVERRAVVLNMALDVQAAEAELPAALADLAAVGGPASGAASAGGPAAPGGLASAAGATAPDALASPAGATGMQALAIAAGPDLVPVRPGAAAIDAVVAVLAAAERPAIVAGRGAVLAGAGPALRRLGELTGAVLATSAVANGLFAGDPFALGISGGFSTPTAQRLLAEADAIVAFGAALNVWTTRHGALIASDATVVQIDSDIAAIGAHRHVDVGVHGDAREAAEALVAAFEAAAGPAAATPADGTPPAIAAGRRSATLAAAAPAAATAAAVVGGRPPAIAAGRRSAALAAAIAAGRWRDEPYAESRDWLDPRTLSIALDAMLPAERTVVVDSGAFMGYPSMYLDVPDAQGFVFPQAFQCVGLGLGNAIGAAVARPDRLTVAAVGDGGLLMSLPDLETAGRLKPDLLIVVYDDAAYGAEVHHFRPMGIPVELAQFPPTDFAALAEAAGCRGLTARTPADLEGVREWLAHRDRPLVLDAKIDPNICAEWLEEAFRGH